MKLSEREVAILRVLSENTAEVKRGLYAGRVATLAGFKRKGRMDAGATRTLDSMQNKGLVTGSYGAPLRLGDQLISTSARKWSVTTAGREALGEYAFGE